MDIKTALFDYLLRLGDDSLILAQRLSAWCGHGPMLEVDLSMSNIGLDLIGQAALFLGYAGEVEGKGRDADKLAFHRDALRFRNCLLVEQPNGDFAQTIARQYVFSTWQRLLFQGLVKSGDPRIAEIAAKALKEIDYHADWSAEWVVRLGDGTAESRDRMIAGFAWMWRFVDELFQVDDVDAAIAKAGIGPSRASLRAGFDAALKKTFDAATLPLMPYPAAVLGGRQGHHSEHLGHLLAEMQFLPRAYPGATW
ncbi:MAG: phenylacetate-CoA oxygenase subunit PaaC [Rhodospirillaceae bacterium]|nr:phenylacetate-CoA oxygenase subunit PaaC [Rhodospirillaceae bacterium]